ncbi:hypothetical protein RHGRI_036615 [Rhododendron griersonianum]|uniref:Uncharacterized protein n=1 Tax=Rhododendron griersonianum TaxID=479676 RepID=A0AAV6HP55_9ERIC|nr:hypothetical protein RHGRI_036615 [Rhododendron griersonianum]
MRSQHKPLNTKHRCNHTTTDTDETKDLFLRTLLNGCRPELDQETQARAVESTERGLRGKPPLPHEAPGLKTKATPRKNSGRPNAPTATEEQKLHSARFAADHQPNRETAANQSTRSDPGTPQHSHHLPPLPMPR